MNQYKMEPKKYKRVNFYIDWMYGVGAGIYLRKWSIGLHLAFFTIDVEYLTKKDIEKYNRMAEYFAKNIDILED